LLFGAELASSLSLVGSGGACPLALLLPGEMSAAVHLLDICLVLSLCIVIEPGIELGPHDQ
jgi:hypothetical protein